VKLPVKWLLWQFVAFGGTFALLLASASAASAQPLTFFGEDLGLGEMTRLTVHPNADAARNAFLANLLTGVGTENFEGFADGATTPLALNFPGDGTATLLGGQSIVSLSSGTDGLGRFPISGTNYFFPGLQAFAIAFSPTPVAAFGFYGTDIGDFGGQITLTLFRDGIVTRTLTIPSTINAEGGGVVYFGVIDIEQPFNRVEFGNTAQGVDVFGFDDMTVASINQVSPNLIPAPPSLVLGTIGFTGLAWYRLRRRSKQIAG